MPPGDAFLAPACLSPPRAELSRSALVVLKRKRNEGLGDIPVGFCSERCRNPSASRLFPLCTHRRRGGRQHHAPLSKFTWGKNQSRLTKESTRWKDKLTYSPFCFRNVHCNVGRAREASLLSLSDGELNHSTDSSARHFAACFPSAFRSLPQTQQRAPPRTRLFTMYFVNQFSLQNKFLF